MQVRPDLPTYYYVEHFLEMLDFVTRIYGGMLAAAHEDFIADFRALPRPAQCLYVRMANRRGMVFALTALDYAEIGAVAPVIAVLAKKGFVRSAVAEDTPALLARLPKPGLLTLAQSADIAVKASWPKARIVRALGDTLPADTIALQDYVVRARTEVLDYILFLYFGRCETDLKSFALRDLGIIAVHERQDFAARFVDAAEAASCFADSRWRERLRATPEESIAALEYLTAVMAAPTEYAASLRAKVAHEAGQYFERIGETASAIAAYRHGDAPDCRERLVRLLHGDDDLVAVKELLERMIDDPASDAEHDFASDFLVRKFGGRRTGACTELLRGAGRIVIDEAYRQAPEHGAALHFQRQAQTLHHTENWVWHQLFGLIFWDELFGDHAALGSGFDALPPGLRDGRFARDHAPRLAAKLDAMRGGAALPILLRTIAERWGQPNGLVHWPGLAIEALTDLLEHCDGGGLAAMLDAMCRDFSGCRDGFPDLFIIGGGGGRFVEIKATGDSLRRNQLTRLRQLRRAGIAAEICGVDYRFDPAQPYVVIDIETTGGRAGNERVTEIGAVKIQDHQVIGEWQTLLNPQKRIPAMITKLTGISDAMVRDAPLFADVANDFADFMADGVFVAHNVNFDYGFLSAEFGRLERPFRYPKFCTCAEMRRHYPGHASYSLANLCAIYDIDLTGHHRALNDARAAGQLLGLINRKREAA